MSAERAG